MAKNNGNASNGGGMSAGRDKYRDGLLLALRPFLSPERREALDTLLRIARLGSVLRQIR